MKIIRTINRDKVYREASDEDILAIAKDIWEHSDMSDFLASGGDYECFVWGIFNECTRYEIISD